MIFETQREQQRFGRASGSEKEENNAFSE